MCTLHYTILYIYIALYICYYYYWPYTYSIIDQHAAENKYTMPYTYLNKKMLGF